MSLKSGATGGVPTGSGAQQEQYACSACGFAIWRPVWNFAETVLGLYDDARFPGRCLLAWREHVTRLEDLPSDLIGFLMRDAALVGSVLREVVAADRINYAVLGNTEPHLHVHIIPRLHRIDPIPHRPPWEHPAPAASLPEGQLQSIIADIAERLAGREY